MRQIPWIRLAPVLLIAIAIFAGSAAPSARAAEEEGVAGFASIADLALPASEGSTQRLALGTDSQLHVVCFLGCECPVARLYAPRLDALARQFADRGVRFFGVNSNIQDSLEDVERYATDHKLSFPVLKDYDRQVAVRMGATRTPEVFVVDRLGDIRYQGRIDDQYQPGVTRGAAQQHDLRRAIEQLLAGEAVTVPRTTAVGCLMKLPESTLAAADRDDAPTFSQQVSRILQKHCVECHQTGEIGPFALEQYDEVVGWADMMLEVIDEGRMPPWHASPQHGSFVNARHIPQEDVNTLRRWVNTGMTFGNAAELPDPVAKRAAGSSASATADLEFPMSSQPFQVPAEGTVEYQYYVVDPKFTEDKWVSAAEVIPGNRSVVHHCIAFIRPPDGAEIRSFGILGGYVPGQRPLQLPPGFAMRVAARSRIVFQMHYTPTGKPEVDTTRIRLKLADPDAVTHEVYSIGGLEQDFEIPPGAARHTVTGAIRRFPKDGMLLSLTPHMHLRGKSFQLVAERDDGEEILLDVPQYDFNWQHNYQLSDPLQLASVRGLKFVATFDNSTANPFNPDPREYVTWGDQTWQEMAVVFATVAQPLASQHDTKEPPRVAAERTSEQQQRISDRARRRAEQFAQDYIDRFDRNGDGHLSKYEVPDSVRMFAFRSFDSDGDRLVSRDEIFHRALTRFAGSR